MGSAMGAGMKWVADVMALRGECQREARQRALIVCLGYLDAGLCHWDSGAEFASGLSLENEG